MLGFMVSNSDTVNLVQMMFIPEQFYKCLVCESSNPGRFLSHISYTALYLETPLQHNLETNENIQGDIVNRCDAQSSELQKDSETTTTEEKH